eukprot:jgi/Chrzof1/13383/Cz07g31010.t1
MLKHLCVQLGLKALYKMNLHHTIPEFLSDAKAAVPGMTDDIDHVAQWLRRQMNLCNEDAMRVLLARKSFLSSVDLQFVAGSVMQRPVEPEQKHLN